MNTASDTEEQNYTANRPLHRDNTPKDKESMRRIVRQILLDLQFRHKLVGTVYLQEAILVKCAMPQPSLRAMDVYKFVALHHSTKMLNVERAIRNTLYDCHRRGELSKLNEMLGVKVIDKHYPPTSMDFICEIATRIKYGMEWEHSVEDNRAATLPSETIIKSPCWQEVYDRIFGGKR